MDRIQSSPGSGVVPHNVHVMGDFLVTSYYADGVVVHDISDPSNMVEVARYDTYPGTANYTIGNWGVYPFFASGTIIASDIEYGFFVLGSNFNYAARLEGTVTNANNGTPIQGCDVTILGGMHNKTTKVNGTYKTGTVNSGVYTIRFEKYGFETKEVILSLTENTAVTADVELIPLPQYNVKIKVLDPSNNPILGADVRIKHQGIMFDGQTNGLGEVTKSVHYSDTFYVAAGKWGRITECTTVSFSPTMNELTFVLDKGYRDDFSFDFGWSTTSSAESGNWERGIPFLEELIGLNTTPFGDSPFDCGDFCFITGNSDGNHVTNGEVTLISPVFDLSSISDPYVNFDYWFFNYYGYTPYNDTLRIAISNGTSLVEIEKKGHSPSLYGEWTRVSKRIADYVSPTATMQLFIQTSNYNTTHNITNAAFDNFAITSGSPLAISEEKTQAELKVYPNPFDGIITIEGELKTNRIRLFNLQGKEIMIQNVNKTEGKTTIETGFIASGTYFLHVNEKVHVLVKQ